MCTDAYRQALIDELSSMRASAATLSVSEDGAAGEHHASVLDRKEFIIPNGDGVTAPAPHAEPKGPCPPMPHSITLIRSSSLSDVAEYAYAATAPAGSRMIFLAGACPLNEDGSTAAVGDYRGQAAKAFENMRIALSDAGADVEDVLSTRVLVATTRQEDLVAAWEVVRDSFGEHDVPSTLMGVTVLGYQDQLVELEAVAAVLDS
jgi:enamine deaminase RidA (YjgF/YER057c/UK114 family)